MALRKHMLTTGEVYHVFNHSVGRMPIFRGARECGLFLEAMKFYLQPNPPTRFSIYRTARGKFSIQLNERLVTVICYCLMPNHFHITLRQEEDDGIKKFIQRVSNSFAHYFNLKYDKRGHVFEGNFKSVHVEKDEQLVHLSRYIHLNPVTAYLVENPIYYPYSSYKAFIGEETLDFVDPTLVLQQFPSREEYKKFVLSQKDYQRAVKEIEHLILE